MSNSSSFRSKVLLALTVALGVGSGPIWSQMPNLEDPTAIPPMLELPHAKLPAPEISTDIPWPWWYFVVAAIVIFTLLYLLAYFLRSLQSNEPEPPLPALQEAGLALKTLTQEADSMAVTQLSHHLSLIIRRYQSRKFLEPFQCKTMQEIYEQTHLTRFNSVKSLFQPLAEELDSISFTPNAEATERKQALIDSVKATLEKVDRTPLPNPSPEVVS